MQINRRQNKIDSISWQTFSKLHLALKEMSSFGIQAALDSDPRLRKSEREGENKHNEDEMM